MALIDISNWQKGPIEPRGTRDKIILINPQNNEKYFLSFH